MFTNINEILTKPAMWSWKSAICVILCLSFMSTGLLADDRKFPAGFKFGVASSSYQVEGAWNASDKGESIWDRLTHSKPESIADRTNGDVACDSYHLYKRDVEMCLELGVTFYRFSISWPRLLPNGFSNYISEDGKDYYNNLINELLANGIEPVVTMYHWDLPQKLQDLGGWTNPLIVDWFTDYAKVLYSLYADRVKTWITINEPISICDEAYNSGIFAPSIIDPDRAGYICNKHVLLAHAKAWRIYDEKYKSGYQGQVSIANHLFWFEAVTEEDQDLAELVNQYNTGRYSHPIYSKGGGWPPTIEKIIEENSRREGYSRSRLPAFTQYEIELIKGTYDFYGLNHYTSRLVRRAKDDEELRPWSLGDVPELRAKLEMDPDWNVGSSGLTAIYPKGIRSILNWLKREYGDINIFITENGYCTYGHDHEEEDRITYYSGYLEQLLLAIKDDKINVTRYTAWTLMDNFEWMDGYRTKFGLYEVNFEDPERRRIPRKSAEFYASVAKTHKIWH